ncbi:MAG: class I adenylate cyclase [Spirochaetes bacterium]|nr:class I adenylate cyclase [Spirochaetota bacterium]
MKFDRFQQLFFNVNIKRVINSIPALLSMNNKKIPGYLDGKCPYGIFGYMPDTETAKYIKARFGVEFVSSDKKSFVEMLAVMGSVGTIAYNKKSDFDYWVCIDKSKTDSNGFDLFLKKIEEVQKWAMKEAGVEVHLFINDVYNLKMNIFAEDADEGFGSTTGAVLKDEFFRSSIIVAGKIPFWWVLPKFVTDDEYDRVFNNIPEEEREKRFIDIGNLFKISKEDFMGAALFQLIKAIGNPFKSILKIGILESYLFGNENTLLLSQKVKTAIIRDDITPTILDSYLLMFNEVYNYYEEVLNDKSLLVILRQNLYLKIDPQLSKYLALKDKKNLPYKVVVMFKVIREWGWSIDVIRDLDDFESWDYSRMIQFWNYIKKFMLLSYQKISREMPAMNLQNKISKSDFKLLSSKLKANFSMEPEKIENFITFKDTPNESYLYIEPDIKGTKIEGWRVYKKIKSNKIVQDEKEVTIKSEDNLVKLLAWCSINQVYEPTFSRLYVDTGYYHINKSLIIELLNKIFEMFNSEKIHLGNKFYLQNPRTYKNMIIMNFSYDKANSINSLYHLYMNTWGEAFLKHYTDTSDLVMIFSDILKDGLLNNRSFDEFCYFVSPEPHKKLYRQIERTFSNAYNFFMSGKPNIKQRVLLNIDDKLVCATKDDKEVTVATFHNDIELLSYISQRPFKYSDNRIFQEDNPRLFIIDEIYKKRENYCITIVLENRQKYNVIYIMDGIGNIFTFAKRRGVSDYFSSTYRFCTNIVSNIQKSYAGKVKYPVEKIKCFKLDIDKYGKINFKDDSLMFSQRDYIYKVDEDAIMINIELKDNITLYSIRSNAGNIDGIRLNQFPEKIKELGKNQTCEIIDIKFHNFPAERIELGSTLYFYEKYKIEKMLGAIL